MQSLDVTSNDWVSLNAALGIAVGDAFQIQNISTNALLLQESDTKPNISDHGVILFDSRAGDLSKANISSRAQEIWVKVADAGRPSRIIVGTSINVGFPAGEGIPNDMITSWPVGNRRIKVETLPLGNRYVVDGLGFSLNWREDNIIEGTSRYAAFTVPAGFYLAVDHRLLNPSGDNFIYRVYPQGTFPLGAVKTDDGDNFVRLRNYRQNSTFNPAIVARYNVTVVPTATQFVVYAEAFGSVNAGNRSEGDLASDEAFLLLSPNQQFLLEMRSNGATNPMDAQILVSLALIPEVSIPAPLPLVAP